MKIAVIGGGAAGLMASCVIQTGETSLVTLYDKNALLGKKLRITGKGRCNVCNTATVEETEGVIVRGGKFLRTALYAFPPDQVYAFFENAGVPLKKERGGRVFPVSDKAADIAGALIQKAKKKSGFSVKNETVLNLEKEGDSFVVTTAKGKEIFDRVLLATGGKSYPLTGSDGDGYRFAKALGHTVIQPKPALVPLIAKEDLCQKAQGLSLKNCALTVKTEGGKTIYEDFGEMLFCHFGISGPMVLSASSYLDFDKEKSYRFFLDLKPALTEEETHKRVLSDFRENQNKDLVNAMDRLLPQKLIAPLLEAAELDGRKKVHLVTKEERSRLVRHLKALPLTVIGTRPLSEAIITRGGIPLKEVNPRTMESRITKGLFFAGEVLDADALTGGFNLQIAFSTGYLAGESITKEDL